MGAPEPAAPRCAPLSIAWWKLLLLFQSLFICLQAFGDHGFCLGQFCCRQPILSVEPSYQPSCGDRKANVRVTVEGGMNRCLAAQSVVVKPKFPGVLTSELLFITNSLWYFIPVSLDILEDAREKHPCSSCKVLQSGSYKVCLTSRHQLPDSGTVCDLVFNAPQCLKYKVGVQ